jgi:hypothetical protein
VIGADKKQSCLIGDSRFGLPCILPQKSGWAKEKKSYLFVLMRGSATCCDIGKDVF